MKVSGAFLSLLIGAFITLTVFAFQLALTSRLNQHDDLTMINRYFDADNAWYLVNFETGNQTYGSYGGRNFVHPNVANFIHPLVWTVSKVTGISLKDVSLAVGPFFAGLRSGLLFVALTIAGFGLADALLAALLVSIAFSSVLFGCLPESFVISSAFFALFFLLAAMQTAGRRIHWGYWVVCGMLLSSVTITNLAPFAIGLLFLDTAKTTARISGLALAATTLLFLLLTAAHGSFRGIGARHIGQLEELRFSANSMFFGFPKALAHSLVPILPNQMTGADEEHPSSKIQIVRFTYRDDLERIKRYVTTIIGYRRFSGGSAIEIAALILMTSGVLFSSRVWLLHESAAKILYQISLAQLSFHWILHSFFGLELMLYSQHWIVPLVVAICAGLTQPIVRVITVALIVLAAIQTTAVMATLIRL